MKYSETKKATILGIGGEGAYYLAKFLFLLGVQVEGFDMKESEGTKELEKLGAKINYRNPEEDVFDTDFYIFSSNIPSSIMDNVFKANPKLKKYEVGEFYHKLVKDYENNLLNEKEKDAFLKSDIAPLFNIDFCKMRYISVTGTDGKTTTSTMVYHMLKENGFKPALITTVAAYIGNEQIDTGFHTTTPTAQNMFELIKKAEKNECTHIIIETTSHGLEQGRLAGIKFDNIGYTNITTEHLDYHKTRERYFQAKALLITDHLKKGGSVTLNEDDDSFVKLKEIVRTYSSYSIEKEADFYATDIVEGKDSISLKVNDLDCTLPLIGLFNVSNFLCALSICSNEGIHLEDLLSSIESLKPVVGRMEVLQQKPFVVIVDFAHTSNSTLNALRSAKKLVKDNGRLIHVFGCAGQRDPGKRYEMGKTSNEYADITILTAEDPRFESLKNINDEIERGWRDGGNKETTIFRFDDDTVNVKVRRDAIRKAFDLAQENDVIIITGKSHESSLCFGNVEYDWNDIDEVTDLVNEFYLM